MVTLANACKPFAVRSDVRVQLPRCFAVQAFGEGGQDTAPAEVLDDIWRYLKDPGEPTVQDGARKIESFDSITAHVARAAKQMARQRSRKKRG